MEPETRRGSASTVRSRDPDWLSPTSDDSEALLLQRLEDLVGWSGWLTLCSAEREPAFADVR
jgi:hypothetical protein